MYIHMCMYKYCHQCMTVEMSAVAGNQYMGGESFPPHRQGEEV